MYHYWMDGWIFFFFLKKTFEYHEEGWRLLYVVLRMLCWKLSRKNTPFYCCLELESDNLRGLHDVQFFFLSCQLIMPALLARSIRAQVWSLTCWNTVDR
jgi:hypothetical protein